MFLKKLVVLVAALSLSMACQTQEEKEAEEFLKELEDWEEMPDPVYLTDYEVCVEFLMYLVPVIAQCEGTTVDPGLEERVIAECTAMQCNNTDEYWSETITDECISYYGVCGDPIENSYYYQCDVMMVTCVDPDVDTNTDVDTE